MHFKEFKDQYQKVPVEHYPSRVSDKPLVSVCVQTYQQVNFIRQCLDGILMQQTNFDFDILLGEDDSIDGTREICIEYAQKHPEKIRLFLHDRKNNIARNGYPTGRFNFLYNLYSARGRYIAACEGDDYWIDSLKLQKQVDLMEKYPQAGMCVALIRKLNDKTKEETLDSAYTGKNFPLIYFNDLTQYFHTSTYLIRKLNLDFLLKSYLHLFNGDTTLRYLLIAESPFVVLNEIVSVYRINEGGIWSSMNAYNRDLQHYILYKAFRKGHYKIHRHFYLANEKRYLKSIINHLSKTAEMQKYLKFKLNYFLLVFQYETKSIPGVLFAELSLQKKSVTRALLKSVKNRVKNFLKQR